MRTSSVCVWKRAKGLVIAAMVAAIAGGAAMPAATAGATLPDNRAYELVSPGEKGGSDIIGERSRIHASAGESPSLPAAITFASFGAFGDVRGTGLAAEYLAQRDGAPGTSGWITHGITPPQEPLSVIAVAQSHEPLYVGEMSDDLTTGIFRSWSPLTDAPNVKNVVNLYARRDLRTAGAGSYQLLTDAMAPLPPETTGIGFQIVRPSVAGSSADFRHVLFEDRDNLTADATGNNVKLYKADDGVSRLVTDGSGECTGGLTPTAPCSAAGLGANFLVRTPAVISSDGSRVNFTAPINASGTVSSASRLYQLDDQGTTATDDDAVFQLNASEKDTPDAPAPAEYQTASSDGTRVFFTSTEQLTNTPGSGLYMWERQPTNESQTVTVDATGGSFTLTTQAGAANATTTSLPVGASTAEVEAALESLRTVGRGNVTVRGSPGGPYDITFVGALAGVDVPKMTGDGSGLSGGARTVTVDTTSPVHNLALVATSVTGVIGASEDGHSIYFASGDQLVPGAPPPLSGSGIYLWQDTTGTPGLSFVAPIDPSAISSLINRQWNVVSYLAHVTPDGRHLAFEVIDGSGLPPGYQHGTCGGLPCEELYVYSADGSTPTSPDVVCASCDLAVPQAPFQPVLDPRAGGGLTQRTPHLNRIISDDGRRVFFSTNQALAPADVNGKFDAYEYDVPTRTVHLISSGTDPADSYFMDASADGHDVYFLTRQQLVGWDRDSAYDLYDARIDGGFPEPALPAKACVGDACQDQPPSPPAAALFGSSAFKGLGNLQTVSPSKHARARRCKKGRVKKRVHGKVRCVKRPHRAKRGKRASAGRRVR